MSTRAAHQPDPPRRLEGQTVLVTRPARQADTVVHRLASAGAQTRIQPTVVIEPVADASLLDREIHRIADYHGLVFASANGVTHWFARQAQIQDGLTWPQTLQWVAIGPSTAREIQQHVNQPVAIPPTASSEGLADWMIEQSNSDSLPWLIVRGNRGSHVLSARLERAGIRFVEVIGYQSVDIVQLDPQIMDQLDSGQIDWVMLTSTAIARSAVALLGKWLPRIEEPWTIDLNHGADGVRKLRVASISPTTTAAIRELGMDVTVEAEEYSIDGMIHAMQQYS